MTISHRDQARVLAVLHRDAAIAGYGDILPTEAPPPTLDEVLAQWTHWLGPDWEAGRRTFVAEVGSSAVGVVLAGPDPIEPDAGHLARLYVTPERWAQGIGRELYEAAISHLRVVGFVEVTLWVLEGNSRARSWYERLGWRPTGERKSVFAPAGIEDIRYRLTLKS